MQLCNPNIIELLINQLSPRCSTVKHNLMKRTYSYYSNLHRAWAHVDAKNKKEVLEFAKADGENIKLSDISLLMINNVYVCKNAGK